MTKKFIIAVVIIWFISACSFMAAGSPPPGPAPQNSPQSASPTPYQPLDPTAAAIQSQATPGALPGPAPEVVGTPMEVGGGAPQAGGGGDAYPSTPETVVSGFLVSFQENAADWASYLSAGRLMDMPYGGAKELMGIDGRMEGFAIQAASVNPPAAIIDVGLVVDGTSTERRFSLLLVNNRWMIDKIEEISSS
jgi:hypothetical protein